VTSLQNIPAFLVSVFPERIEIAPDRPGEKRHILADNSLATKKVIRNLQAKVLDHLTIRVLKSSRPMVAISMLSILLTIRFDGTISETDMTHKILPPLGSTILNNDRAKVDFPDPVLPTYAYRNEDCIEAKRKVYLRYRSSRTVLQ
jgi:hypothetical protein